MMNALTNRQNVCICRPTQLKDEWSIGKHKRTGEIIIECAGAHSLIMDFLRLEIFSNTLSGIL